MTMPGKPGKAAQATLDIMHACKAAVTDADVLGIVTSVVHAPLAKFPDLAEDDAKTLQLFLTFVRNIACIPDALDVAKASAKFHFSTLSVRFQPQRPRGRHGRARAPRRTVQQTTTVLVATAARLHCPCTSQRVAHTSMSESAPPTAGPSRR